MIEIDFIADVTCPWCFVGREQLEVAIRTRDDLAFDVSWRPFELNPGIPIEGRERKIHYKEKFGDTETLNEMTDLLVREGEVLGIQFHFDEIARVPNTMNVHRVLLWSKGAGVQDALARSLFSTYFEEGIDISDHQVLSTRAGEHGMDADLVLQLLGTDRDIRRIEDEMARARTIGVNSVPTIILDNKLVVVGAQQPQMFLQAFDRLLEQEAPH